MIGKFASLFWRLVYHMTCECSREELLCCCCCFFPPFLLVAAFKLLPRQSRRNPQLQRNQLGVVGWRLMGNLLLSPPRHPPPSRHPPTSTPTLCAPMCMNSPARGSTLPPRETWSFKCRTEFCSGVRQTRLRYLTNGLFQLRLLGFNLASHGDILISNIILVHS